MSRMCGISKVYAYNIIVVMLCMAGPLFPEDVCSNATVCIKLLSCMYVMQSL